VDLVPAWNCLVCVKLNFEAMCLMGGGQVIQTCSKLHSSFAASLLPQEGLAHEPIFILKEVISDVRKYSTGYIQNVI
jgi:hypothetical protein